MKKFLLYLLTVLLLAALAMCCAVAEGDQDLILGDGSGMELQIESTDGIVLDDEVLTLDNIRLSDLEEIDDLRLEASPENMEAATVPSDNAVESNDGAPDFEIENGVLVKYNGPGGDVVIPDSVTAIGEKAFYECSSLTSITIPNSVTIIDSHAFFNCTALSNVTIPNSVTMIGVSAFSHCESLTAIDIPDSVVELDKCAFSTCSNLTRISLPSNINVVGSRTGIWREYELAYATFKDCNNITNVIIGDGCSIPELFPCYSNITTVSIRPGVTAIESGAFSRCGGLTNVSIPDSVTSIGGGAFYLCKGLTDISIPNSVTSIGNEAFAASGLNSITIPNSVTSIGSEAFDGCSGLTSITIPNSVTSIGVYAFRGCTSLSIVTIPNSIASIENGEFCGCTSLANITIPNSVTSIGEYAFSSCSSLANITIPDNVTDIGKSTFENCTHLSYFILPYNVSIIEENTFKGCRALESFTIKNGKVFIDDTAFANGSNSLTFHVPCGSDAAKWAEKHNYYVDRYDHTPVTDPAVAPTVSSTGLTEGSHCSVCGEVLAPQQVIPKLISINDCTITNIKDTTYTGKAIQPSPTVKYGGKKLVKGTDYTITYANNKAIGTATVTITGIGKYGEAVKKTFTINPKAVALSAVSAGKNQLTVKWKKGKAITGYEVQYSLKKSFAGAKTIVIKKAGAVKTVLKGLTPNKTYFVRVRAYKAVGSKKYYSAWSKAKNAKPKK